MSKVCLTCGGPIKRGKNYARDKYCSKMCVDWKACGSGRPQLPDDERNPKWYITKNPHRQVMADLLGVEKLPRNIDVHHIDGNKHNNDPGNLAVVTRAAHLRLHRGRG